MMNEPPPFHAFGLAHSVVLCLTAALALGLSLPQRRLLNPSLDIAVRFAIGSILIVNFFCYTGYLALHGNLVWRHALPFQLCDWTMAAVLIALALARFPKGGTTSVSSPSSLLRDGTEPVPPSNLFYRFLEVAYFWGIGGSLQAILTPNLPVGFPDIRFFSFFLEHCGIVIGVTYLLITRNFRPTMGSVWRTLLWSETYLVVTLLVDYATGANYGFLMQKPEAASLLSLLSDRWPLYILQMNGLALIFFAILYAPFAILDLVRSSLKNAGNRQANI